MRRTNVLLLGVHCQKHQQQQAKQCEFMEHIQRMWIYSIVVLRFWSFQIYYILRLTPSRISFDLVDESRTGYIFKSAFTFPTKFCHFYKIPQHWNSLCQRARCHKKKVEQEKRKKERKRIGVEGITTKSQKYEYKRNW